jgi:DNA-directed RNA polymerase specialized sigma24 family protein
MEETKKIYQQNKFHGLVVQTFSSLIQLKKEGKKEAFNQLILKILPSIKKYIQGRLNAAIKKGHFSKNKYNVDEFIDQLFIEVYNHLDEVKTGKYFYLWVFKKTDELLEDCIVEEEFDELFFENIDDYSKPERDEMLEPFSMDADGDLIMIDELDDSSYKKNDYILNHVFIQDDEQDYIDKLDKKLKKDEVQRHIETVLHKLPIQMQSVFELSAYHQFKIEDIVKIKRMSIKEVAQLLQNARNSLRSSFLNRYLIDN